MSTYTTGTENRLTSDGVYNYTYDNDGNLLTQTRIADGQTWNFTWDYWNRLTEVVVKTSGGTVLQDDMFTYDMWNRRIGKSTLAGGQSWTVYNGTNPYADFNSSGTLTYRYLYGDAADFLLARFDGTNTAFYLTDLLGSVRMLVDKNANILDQLSYDSYGNILSETSPSNGDRFKYTGREWDSEIGLYYYRARYYTPAAGRFVSEDPMGFAARDANLYRYAGNAPSTRTDPSGEFSLGNAMAGAAGGAIGGAVGGSIVPGIGTGTGAIVGGIGGFFIGGFFAHSPQTAFIWGFTFGLAAPIMAEFWIVFGPTVMEWGSIAGTAAVNNARWVAMLLGIHRKVSELEQAQRMKEFWQDQVRRAMLEQDAVYWGKALEEWYKWMQKFMSLGGSP